jgi:aspartate-semialdehyde dehydrogenase
MAASSDATGLNRVKVGFVGWRGMVGSVLMERMETENDFDESFEPLFFSTSSVGSAGPRVAGKDSAPLGDANSVAALALLDVIVTCQGGDYTREVHPKLRELGWNGYWIDAASALRMEKDAVIVLDPLNRSGIDEALAKGQKDFVGGNCTVSLMLLALGGLFKKGWVEWVSSMTYQAASGAGAKNMRELVKQMRSVSGAPEGELLDNDNSSILDLDRAVASTLRSPDLPSSEFGVALAGSLIPWIDKAMPNGQTKEEWKGGVEANKIMGMEQGNAIPIDGQCVRIGSMRCHSQALTVKLTHDVPMEEVEAAIAGHNDWVKLVPNNKADTLAQLTPACTTGTLDIPVGRLRKMTLGPKYLTAFTVGDQLLWGAAEPVRRMMRIALEHIHTSAEYQTSTKRGDEACGKLEPMRSERATRQMRI